MEENKNEQEVQGTKATKKSKPSATYTLTQFEAMIEKLEELKLLDEKDLTTMKGLRQKAKAEFIKSL